MKMRRIATVAKFCSLCLFFMGTSTMAYADDNHTVTTRFGIVDTDSNTVIFKGQTTTPKISGNGGLMPLKVAETTDADFLVLTSVGGTACPASYAVAKVTASGVQSTTFFGNCNDGLKTTVIPGGKIILSFPKFTNRIGHFGSPPSLITHAAETYVYDIQTGKMTKNGRPFISDCKISNGTCQG